jgi:hypothetical protein
VDEESCHNFPGEERELLHVYYNPCIHLAIQLSSLFCAHALTVL